MPNCTDLKSPDAAHRVLLAVADHFTATNPGGALEAENLLVCVGAEAYKLVNRRENGEGPALSKAAVALLPELREDITRGEYALLLRAVLPSAGRGWAEDDNQRAIPAIPRPRTAPALPGPNQSAASTRCGRTRGALVLVSAPVKEATV
ncbi:hypothetical protein [Streptomyces sp. NPDC092952]|uniref:hypothetical protein n=1 Tax=Streptomyces sp. NPDC092952 TaxID=3366018 RepID=UPI0037F587DD